MIELATLRARRNDPATSHEAAARSVSFVGSHEQQIVAALLANGPGSAEDLSAWTGLTVVQIDRRIKRLVLDEQVYPHYDIDTLQDDGPIRQAVVNGFRVWEAI